MTFSAKIQRRGSNSSSGFKKAHRRLCSWDTILTSVVLEIVVVVVVALCYFFIKFLFNVVFVVDFL